MVAWQGLGGWARSSSETYNWKLGGAVGVDVRARAHVLVKPHAFLQRVSHSAVSCRVLTQKCVMYNVGRLSDVANQNGRLRGVGSHRTATAYSPPAALSK